MEDSASVRNTVTAVIAKTGMTYAVAGSLVEMQELHLTGATSLILLDLALDRSDAIEVLRYLAARGFDGSIVPMSGQDDAVVGYVTQVGLEAGLRICPALKKPFRIEALRRVLASHVRPRDGLVNIDLADAIAKGMIEVWHEPRVQLTNGGVFGFESSARLRHPELGPIRSHQFAESLSGDQRSELAALTLAGMIEAWASMSRVGIVLKPYLTVHAHDLAHARFMDIVTKRQPEDPRWPGPMLKIREPHLIDEVPEIRAAMVRSQLYKCQYALAEFGAVAGQLVKSPELKLAEIVIEPRLTRSCDTDPERLKVCAAGALVAKRLGVRAAAEGVATEGEAATLRDVGVHLAQGSRFSSPLPLKDLTRCILHQASGRACPI